MSWDQIAGLVLALLVMAMGLAGSALPGIPGPPLVLAAAIGHRLWFGAASVSNLVLGTLAGLVVLALALDYVASLVGAKKLGATWRGVTGAAVGAVVGAVVGIFTGPLGIVAAPFAGATLGELLGGREFREAARAGLGAVLGLLAGVVGKVACSAAMIGLFVASVVMRS